MQDYYFESKYPENARFDDIKQLTDFIKKGACAQLISIPGAGRATVFRLLAHNKKVRIKHFAGDQNKFHFVVLGFDEVRGRSLFDVTKFIFLALADSLKERDFKKSYNLINKLFKEGLEFNDELVLFQKLKDAIDYLTLSEQLKLIFLFDHFEEYIPTVTKQFFVHLRTLRNRAKYNFVTVFSLTRPLENILDPDMLSDFYEFVSGNHVYLTLFDRVSTDFRISYVEKIVGKKLPVADLKEIIKQTGGVGKLIKLATETMLTISNEKENNGAVEQWSSGAKDFLFSQKPIREALSEICRSLNPSEQITLIRENYDNAEAVDYLKSIGILNNNKIQIPLFEEHIKLHRGESKIQSGKIVFDENDNTIKKGEAILSDQLTKSEYKLLCYLLQNADKILSRDEMINATWSDLKSTEGITDQAVDQLIFRLRRKIEENPNSPQHLFTIKGRGFKFIA